MTDKCNGNNAGVKWVMGIIASLVVVLIGAFMANIIGRQSTTESTLAARGERIALLEGSAMEYRRSIDDVKARLSRIEDKIDTLNSIAGKTK